MAGRGPWRMARSWSFVSLTTVVVIGMVDEATTAFLFDGRVPRRVRLLHSTPFEVTEGCGGGREGVPQGKGRVFQEVVARGDVGDGSSGADGGCVADGGGGGDRLRVLEVSRRGTRSVALRGSGDGAARSDGDVGADDGVHRAAPNAGRRYSPIKRGQRDPAGSIK